MDQPRRRGAGGPEGEPAGEGADPAAERRDEPAARRKGDRKAGKPAAKKVKMTISVAADFAGKLKVTAASLGVDVGELVETLTRPQLRGYSAPTIPDELKALFGRDRAPAS